MEMTEKLALAFAGVWDAARKATKAIAEVMQTWKSSRQWQFILAYGWARGSHPEWVKILDRTKKKRIRKKYRDRILRAYLEATGEG